MSTAIADEKEPDRFTEESPGHEHSHSGSYGCRFLTNLKEEENDEENDGNFNNRIYTVIIR